MAYVDVVSLVKVLDQLTINLHKMLKVKIVQAKLFIEKVGELIRVLEMEGPPTLPAQLLEDIAGRAKVSVITLLPIIKLKEYISPVERRKLLGSVPELVEQIGLNEKKLEKFLNESDFYDSWDDLRHNLALLPSRQAARDLLHSSQELKDTVNLVHEVATESYFLFQHLECFQEFAELCQRSNKWHCCQSVKGIMDVAKRALDALECADKYHLRSEMEVSEVHHMQKLKYRHSSAQLAKKNGVTKMIKEFFDGKTGKRLVLLETLGRFHSFTEAIEKACGKLDREDPQSRNASFGRNGFPSLSMIRDKFAREDLPSLPITYYLQAFFSIEGRKRKRANSFL